MNLWLIRLAQAVSLYVALVLHVAYGDAHGPHWVLVVLSGWLVRLPNSQVVLLAALCGLSCDLAGHQQLGLHLASLSGWTVVLLAGWPAAWRYRDSSAPCLAFCLTGAHAATTALVAHTLNPTLDATPTHLLAESFRSAVVTASVVLFAVVVIGILRRLIQTTNSPRGMEVQNQWLRLSEG